MRLNLPPALLLALATLFWGGNFVIGRAVSTDIPPVNLTFWRWLLSALVLLPFVATGIWKHRHLITKHYKLLFMLSLNGMAIFHSFTYIALGYTTAINAAVMLASMPMVIPVFSFLLGHERLMRLQAAGIAISMVGVLIIISRGDVDVLRHFNFNPGDVWVLGAVVAWSVYSVLLKRLPKELPSMTVLGTMNWIAVAILLPFYVWEFQARGGFELSAPNLLALGYVALFASIAAFVCWNGAVHQVGANKAGLYIHLIPLFAALLAIVFLGERLELYHFAGLAPIALGIYLTTIAKPRSPQPSSPAE